MKHENKGLKKYDTTEVRSIIEFSVNGENYRIIFNGCMHSANVVIAEYYPNATGKTGYTEFIPFLTRGEYSIVSLPDLTLLHYNKITELPATTTTEYAP